METIVPRYEYRWFSLDISEFTSKLQALGGEALRKDSQEAYLLSTKGQRINCKMRDQMLDVKELVSVDDGLELWTVKVKEALPVSRDDLESEILPLLGINMSLRQEEYDMEEILDKIVPNSPELNAVHVQKRRFIYTLDGCTAEHADLLVNGAFIRTIAIESESAAPIQELRSKLGLDGKENVSYLGELKRITGMVPLVRIPELPEKF